MRIRRKPLRVMGNGWGIYAAVFCGEHWYRLSSWKKYSKPLIRKLKWDNGFSVGPFLFYKEG